MASEPRPRRRSLSGPSPLGWGDQTNQGSDYTEGETEFLLAVQKYKDENRRPYPHWREIYHLFLSLGYVKKGKE
jgi:hypothetical protein